MSRKGNLRDEFVEVFNKVFDEDYNVKACGRDNCSKLIDLAEKIRKDTDFGNFDNGTMNAENIIILYREIS